MRFYVVINVITISITDEFFNPDRDKVIRKQNFTDDECLCLGLFTLYNGGY